MSISRNTTYNITGSMVPLVVSLVTIPIYMRLIGEARYGVLAIVWLLLGYFGLFDLGLGRATAQRIAALRDSTIEERAQTFWTALTMNLGLGVGGGLLIWPIGSYFFANVFKIDEALRPEMQAAVPWLILAVPMATLSGVLTGALQGREKFLDLNLISACGTVLFQLLPLSVAMIWSVNLNTLLPASIFARLLILLLLFKCCWKHVFFGQFPSFACVQAGQLLRFGGWVSVSAFVGPMMVILDRFIIGALSGAKAVTFYTVPFQIGERSTIFSSSLTSAMFPRFAAAMPEEEQRLARKGLCVLAVVMTPLIATGVLLMEPFLTFWINTTFASQSALVGQVLLLGFWINGFAKIAFAQLQARGRPDLVAKCHLCEVLPYFGLLYLGLSQFGLAGAAVAFSLRVFLDFVLLAGYAGILRLSLRMLLPPSLILTGAFLLATKFKPENDVWLVLVVLYLLFTMAWAWRRAPDSIRDSVAKYLKPIARQ